MRRPLPILNEWSFSTFHSLMSQVFRPFLRRFVLVFFVDILVYSPDRYTHRKHLGVVLSTLQENFLYANWKNVLLAGTVFHIWKSQWGKDPCHGELVYPSNSEGITRFYRSYELLSTVREELWVIGYAVNQAATERCVWMDGKSDPSLWATKAHYGDIANFGSSRF